MRHTRCHCPEHSLCCSHKDEQQLAHHLVHVAFSNGLHASPGFRSPRLRCSDAYTRTPVESETDNGPEGRAALPLDHHECALAYAYAFALCTCVQKTASGSIDRQCKGSVDRVLGVDGVTGRSILPSKSPLQCLHLNICYGLRSKPCEAHMRYTAGRRCKVTLDDLERSTCGLPAPKQRRILPPRAPSSRLLQVFWVVQQSF